MIDQGFLNGYTYIPFLLSDEQSEYEPLTQATPIELVMWGKVLQVLFLFVCFGPTRITAQFVLKRNGTNY